MARRNLSLVIPFGVLGIIALFVVTAPEPASTPRWAGAGDDEPRSGGTFVFHHETNIRTFDPAIGYDTVSNMGNRLLFDSLLDYDEHTELTPSLAESLPELENDGKTLRFRLRRGVKFHNGREVIAEDYKWSLERLLSTRRDSPGVPFFHVLDGVEEYRAGDADHVRGIVAEGPYELTFYLREPDQTFLNALAMPFATPLPREHYEIHDARDDAGLYPCGTGPFYLPRDGWERGVRAEFRRFEEYWKPRAAPDVMVFEENLTRYVAAMRFRNGDIDAVHRFTTTDYLWFKQASAWQPHSHEEALVNMWGVVMNTQMAPFDNVELRRAVAYAMDREGWQRARSGRLVPTNQPVPPSLPGFHRGLGDVQRFDLEIAREHMALAGYPVREIDGRFVAEGFPDDVKLLSTNSEGSSAIAEMVQDDLRQIGIHVELQQRSFPVYLEESGKPDTVQMLVGGWSMDFPDPSNFLEPLFHSQHAREQNASNRSFYRNPTFDALLDAARVETDREARLAMYREAIEILANDAPWAFSFNETRLELWQPYVKNYRFNPVYSQDYRHVWLDLPRREVARRFGPAGPGRGLRALLPAFGRRSEH
ncbi:MAG: ABC transporter substrate-binding protein [Myxococcota bacterium]